MLSFRRGNRIHLLHVIGQDDAGHGAVGQGDPDRPVDQVTDLGRIARHVDEMAGHILEEGNQIHFLLVFRAKGGSGLLPDYGHHRLMVQLRIVQAVQQADRPRTRGCYADAHFAGKFRMSACHERRIFFMAGLDELYFFPEPVERTHDAVDPVAGIPVDAAYSPFVKAMNEIIAGRPCHAGLLSLRAECISIYIKSKGCGRGVNPDILQG